ncbi:MAG: effector-associated domain EAD1-containing protein, partial [Caldilinea sp.]
MTLTGSQISHLLEALLAAYPRLDDLRMMVRVELDENLDAIAGGGALRGVTFSLIEWANRSGRIDELIAGARLGNPGNARLQEFAASLSPENDVSAQAASGQSGLSPSVAALILREKEELLK